ncbi:MAG TPA: hypothetical protein VGO47_00390 [Chlamydiales bacterium]|nr:hypothetical protein [Chlamydiales bacterium]
MGIIANWIDDDWKMVQRLIDFRHLQPGDHTGLGSAVAFTDSLVMHSGLKKICISLLFNLLFHLFCHFYMIFVMMDNASSNDVLARVLARIVRQKYEIHFDPLNGRGRCMPHAINLAAQSFMRAMDEAPDPDNEDLYPQVKHLQLGHDSVEDEILQEYENESETLDLDQMSAMNQYFMDESLEQELGLTTFELSAPLKKVFAFPHYTSVILMKACSFAQSAQK